MDSIYNVCVGCSKMVMGFYFDRDGVLLFDGGGIMVIEGNKDWVVLGYNVVYIFDGKDYLVFYVYESVDNVF